MTEKKGQATHTQSKGKITNGKPGRRTAARAGAGSKRAIQREAPAKSAAQKPQPAIESRQSDAGDPAGIAQPAETLHLSPAKRGLVRLKEKARNMVEKDARQILKGLKQKARKGSASDVKLLVDLARLNEEKPAAKPDDESCMAYLQNLASQPQFREADEGDESGNSQTGVFQRAVDSAESH